MLHRRRRTSVHACTSAVMPSFLVAAIACAVVSLPATMNLPMVNPGLFVLTGVKTCGDSSGYCMLGNNCTMDDDFLPDLSGDCGSLKRAFTPSAPFVCCKFNRRSPPLPQLTMWNSTESTNSSWNSTESTTSSWNSTESTNSSWNYTESTSPSWNSMDFANSSWNNFTSEKTPNIPNIQKNKREWPINNGERIDPLHMDGEQLEKLNQIGLVVKKIVEQLINETANTIREDQTFSKNQTTVDDANAIRNDELGAGDGVEITETITENPSDDDASRTEIIPSVYLENKKDSDPLADKADELDTVVVIEPEASESTIIDDEFRAEKNICQKTCKSEMMFTVDKKPLCYGTLLDELWILTSGTCASRLNKADIRKVAAVRKDWFGPMLSISNILVHENFKYPVFKNSPDNNNLALASLNESLIDQPCIPCFTQRKNLTNEMCRTFQNPNFKNTIKSADNCEGLVQLRKLVVNSYYVLPCSRWRMQYNQEGRLGSGLWCDGKLAGVQTGVGVGSLIYTPVNEYGQWISDNKRIER